MSGDCTKALLYLGPALFFCERSGFGVEERKEEKLRNEKSTIFGDSR